jgi:hypothetical protein
MHCFSAPACTIVLLAAVDTIMAVTPAVSQQEKPNIILMPSTPN